MTDFRKKKRIKWTAHEQLELAREAKRLQPEFPHLAVWQRINKAQTKVLPKDRWRKIESPHWLTKGLLELAEEGISPREAETPPIEIKAVERPPFVFEPEESEHPSVLAAREGVAFRKSVLHALDSLTIQIQKLEDQVKLLRPKDALAEVPVSDATAPPRISVVGTKADQAQEIARTYHTQPIELVFPERERAVNVSGCDWIIVMTQFVKHDIIDSILSKYPRERMLYAAGGVSSVKERINQILRGEGKTSRHKEST